MFSHFFVELGDRLRSESKFPIWTYWLGFGFLRTGRSPAPGCAGATGFVVVPVAGVAAEIPPSVYAFLSHLSASACAPPVSSFVCLALLYSLTARSRCPSKSKIFPREMWPQTSVHFS